MTSYSNTSEPFSLVRDCPAILVPAGDAVTLPAGQHGYITQALGGSFTVYVEGNLFRIAGSEADALGKSPPALPELPEGATEDDLEKAVWQQLRTCFDPEIPINVVELGLIYECNLARQDDGEYRVDIKMTLTAPGCGMGETLADEVRSKVELIPTVAEADVDLVFDPPWSQHMMSEAARLETGMF
jgi:probable FeS assembly SUF system protein SufT